MKDLIQELIASGCIEAIPVSGDQQVEALEEKTGLKLPDLYRQLLRNYTFDTFEMGGIEFFGNTDFSSTNIYEIVFADKIMSPILLKTGFLHFGQPDSGSYDPICFMTREQHGSKSKMVRLDHELILCHGKIKVIEILAPSFPHWLISVLTQSENQSS